MRTCLAREADGHRYIGGGPVVVRVGLQVRGQLLC